MKCVVCQKPTSYNKKHKRYALFCSKECRFSEKGKEIIRNKKQTTYKNKTKEDIQGILDKRKRTVNEKYGVDNPFQSETIKSKSIDKRKKTNQERYGTEYVFQSDEIKTKIKETNQERYGVDNPMHSDEIKDKVKKTNQGRYGVDNVFQSDEIKTKIKKTNQERYGVDSLLLSPEFRKANYQKQRENYYITFLALLKEKHIKPEFDESDYINIDYDETDKKYYCELCDKQFTSKHIKVQKVYCPYHNHGTSAQEKELYSYIQTLEPCVKSNERFYYTKSNYYEVDIYSEEFKIGIEFNGLYWHSELYKESSYHKDKYEFFKERGITLIQIYDSEWVNKQEVIKSFLRVKFNHIEHKIYARQCDVRELDNTSYDRFCEYNHLQGTGKAKVRLGLFHQDVLVMVMSFSKPRFNKHFEWENIRTCSKRDFVIVGGFAKLLSHFQKNYSGAIISYVDVRFFSGGQYLKNGFVLKEHTQPGFCYFKRDSLITENRIKYQKHKLRGLLSNYDETKSAGENLTLHGYLKIYDAGQLVFIIN